jgi:para-nitrobenzyl esterase
MLAEQGNPADRCAFEWAPPGSPFGACHCIDLPFVFGTLDAWREAPMLAGASRPELDRLVSEVQFRWLSFIPSA